MRKKKYKLSPETRERMREAQRRRWARAKEEKSLFGTKLSFLWKLPIRAAEWVLGG